MAEKWEWDNGLSVECDDWRKIALMDGVRGHEAGNAAELRWG